MTNEEKAGRIACNIVGKGIFNPPAPNVNEFRRLLVLIEETLNSLGEEEQETGVAVKNSEKAKRIADNIVIIEFFSRSGAQLIGLIKEELNALEKEKDLLPNLWPQQDPGMDY